MCEVCGLAHSLIALGRTCLANSSRPASVAASSRSSPYQMPTAASHHRTRSICCFPAFKHDCARDMHDDDAYLAYTLASMTENPYIETHHCCILFSQQDVVCDDQAHLQRNILQLHAHSIEYQIDDTHIRKSMQYSGTGQSPDSRIHVLAFRTTRQLTILLPIRYECRPRYLISNVCRFSLM